MNTHDSYLNCDGVAVRKCDECSAHLCNCFVNFGHDCEVSPEMAELIYYIKDLEFLERLSPKDPLVQYLPQARADLAAMQELQTCSESNTEGNTTMETQETTGAVDPNNITAIDRTVSVTEAAALLEVTGQTVRNWVRSGRLTATKHGKTFRIDAEELNGLRSATREIRVVNADEQRG